MLDEAQFIWSTYENKQTRPTRVIVKKLHSSCTPEHIVQELRRKEYQIIDAVNILKWKTKEPVPAFMPKFDRTENIQKYIRNHWYQGHECWSHPVQKNEIAAPV